MTLRTIPAEEVRRIRKMLGMTQSELAAALNVKSRDMIADWESGRKGGQEYLPTGTAVVALEALRATVRAITIMGIHHPASHALLEPYQRATQKKLEKAVEEFVE